MFYFSQRLMRCMALCRVLPLLLCLLAPVSYARAERWTPTTVPSPKVQGQAYYVANPDGVLAQATVDRLNAGIERLNKQTAVELAVVAIDSTSRNPYYPAHNFALKLFNHWGIGDKDKNTGVLVFLVRADRDIQIVTGDGIAGMLTDGKCGAILDNNLDYFKDNDFDAGMLAVCQDIADELMLDKNRAELVLGWKPKDTKTNSFWFWYFLVGFSMLITFAVWGAGLLDSGKPGERVKEVQARVDKAGMGLGCLSLLFPIPMLFYYIWHRWQRDHIKMKPLPCPKCGHAMDLVPKEEHKDYLSAGQMIEEQQIQTIDYDVWRCPECGEKHLSAYKGLKQYAYGVCPKCEAWTLDKVDFKVTKRATEIEKGEQINYYKCLSCGHSFEKTIELRRLSGNAARYDVDRDRDDDDRYRSRSSSSSYSSRSSSSGSWGGGRSSGGGAGRRF